MFALREAAALAVSYCQLISLLILPLDLSENNPVLNANFVMPPLSVRLESG